MSITSISASLLSSIYDVKYGLSADTTGAGASGATSTSSVANLIPPWQSTSTAPKQSALVSAVLKGDKFFNPSAAQLTAPKVANANDYKNLFALYQGVNALQGLADGASDTTLTDAQQKQYAAAFTTGMSQLQTFLGQTSFSTLNVAQGTLTASSTTTQGAPQETDTYTTGTVFSGSASSPVPAFQGDVQFSMSLTNTKGVAKTVNFDLDDMGSTPRTMGNVVNYLNGQLKAAGVSTRFADVATTGAPLTTTVNGQSVALGTAPTNYALEIKGTSTEKVSFTAPTTAPAVYITSASGTPDKAAVGKTAAVPGDQTQQLMKFNASTDDPQTSMVNNNAMDSALSTALASATAPDGSVYVLGDVDATTGDGQTINGAQDVALMKYDSAGNLLYTRTLGAQNSASGYALAVSADGSKVAVAGSVTGALDADDTGESSTSVNGFVTEYDAEGDEQWTTTQPSTAGDVATGVAFGADGSVYVAGTTQSTIPKGGAHVGGQDAYVRSYGATGKITSTIEYGTTGTDTPSGIVVSNGSVYVAGTEKGDAVVRQFAIGSNGLTAGATRDLGALQGNIAGIGVNSDGAIVVGGSTQNGALGGGTITSAYGGGREGFVATLDPSLQPSSSDTVAYLQTPSDFTAGGMTVSGGQAYLTGKVAITAPAGSGITGATDGYVAAIDTSTGQTTWSQEWRGADYQAAPSSISVSATGSSVLDQLGLPTTVDYSKSTLLVDNTSLRPGDSFYIQSGGGAAQKITISSTDTLQTLGSEIQRMMGFSVSATTKTVNGEVQLSIKPANSLSTITLSAGPQGQDALAPLGLSPGKITNAATTASTTAASKKAKVNLGLNLTSTLNLGSATGVKQAQAALQVAAAKIEVAYQNLTKPTGTTSSTASTASAADLAYINARTANYQLALSRLTGSS